MTEIYTPDVVPASVRSNIRLPSTDVLGEQGAGGGGESPVTSATTTSAIRREAERRGNGVRQDAQE